MKVITGIFLVCLFGLSAGFEDKTVVQWLADNGYTTLVTALNATGLTAPLSQPGAFTVFAPTEAAFNKLGAAAVIGLLQDPGTLSLILQYHVVNQFVLVPMINSVTMKDTLNGGQLSIAPNNGGLIINNASLVSAASNDIVVNNGVIQPIDTVLTAPNIPSFTITQFILQDDRFQDLFLALYFANLVTTFDGPGDFTVFAPTDTAFGALAGNVLDPARPDAQALYQGVLQYHVVQGTLMASQLSNGQKLQTLQGDILTVTIDTAGVRINNATVSDTDLRCTNGIIHVIEGVLFPPSLFNQG